jgi:WD40 repeat protein
MDDKPHLLAQFETEVRAAEYLPDRSRLVVSCVDGTVTVLPLEEDATGNSFRAHDALEKAALSRDGARLVTGATNGEVAVWTLRTRTVQRFEGWGAPVTAVAIDDAGAVAAAHSDGIIRRWSGSGVQLPPLESKRSTGDLAFTDNGNFLYAAAWRSIDVWNWSTGERVRTLWGHADNVKGLAFGPGDRPIYSASWDGSVRAWDPDHEGWPVVLRGHDDTVRSVTFSPDGCHLATAGGDGRVILWDSLTHEKLRVLKGRPASVLSFSSDGEWLAIGRGNRIRIHDASTGAVVATIQTVGVRGLAFAPDRSWLVSGGTDGHVRRWDLTTFEQRDVLGVHDARVNRVAVNPQGTRVASASRDFTMKLFDVVGGRELPLAPIFDLDVHDVAFSPDRSELAGAARRSRIYVWSAETGTHLRTIVEHGDSTPAIAFNDDASRMAVGTWVDTVIVLEMPGGEPLATLRGHDSTVWTVAFSPDGTRIASGSFDTTVRIWDSVPETTRRAERAALLARVPEAERLVDRLDREHGNLEDVAAVLRGDAGLDDTLRHAALNVVLRRAATPDRLSPEPHG